MSPTRPDPELPVPVPVPVSEPPELLPLGPPWPALAAPDELELLLEEPPLELLLEPPLELLLEEKDAP